MQIFVFFHWMADFLLECYNCFLLKNISSPGDGMYPAVSSPISSFVSDINAGDDDMDEGQFGDDEGEDDFPYVHQKPIQKYWNRQSCQSDT